MKGIHTPAPATAGPVPGGPVPAYAIPTAAAGLQLARDPAAPGYARRYVTGFLTGHVPRDVSEAAELITSELVTNAVKYGHGRLRLHVGIHHDTDAGPRTGTGKGTGAGADTGGLCTVRLTVTDQSPYTPLPAPEPADTDRENGRGLLLVDALSTRWGHQPVGRTPAAGTAVWAELNAPARPTTPA